MKAPREAMEPQALGLGRLLPFEEERSVDAGPARVEDPAAEDATPDLETF